MVNFQKMKTAPIIGPKINMEINKAFKYAPDDFRVYVESARRYIFTPPFFGGNVDKAIEQLEQALKLHETKDNPDIYYWLGFAYKKKKNFELAKEFLEKAISLKKQFLLAKMELDELLM